MGRFSSSRSSEVDRLDLTARDCQRVLESAGVRHFFLGGYALRCLLSDVCTRKTEDIDIAIDNRHAKHDVDAAFVRSGRFTLAPTYPPAPDYSCLCNTSTGVKVELLFRGAPRMPARGIRHPSKTGRFSLAMLSPAQLAAEKLLAAASRTDAKAHADMADVALLLRHARAQLDLPYVQFMMHAHPGALQEVHSRFPEHGLELASLGLGYKPPALVDPGVALVGASPRGDPAYRRVDKWRQDVARQAGDSPLAYAPAAQRNLPERDPRYDSPPRLSPAYAVARPPPGYDTSKLPRRSRTMQAASYGRTHLIYA